MIQSELVRFEKRVLGEIDQNRRALTSIIINFASEPASAMSTMIEKFKIRDLNLMMKYFNKNVIENLKNRAAKQIIAQINNKIVKIQKILFVFENKVMTFKQFKNKNVFFSIRQKKDVIFFNRFIRWIKMFDANVRVQKKIYEILMHSIRINQFTPRNEPSRVGGNAKNFRFNWDDSWMEVLPFHLIGMIDDPDINSFEW